MIDWEGVRDDQKPAIGGNMPLKSASSKIAIAAAAAFALSSTAMAQTMVGEQEIIDDADMQLVETRCAELTGDAEASEADDPAIEELSTETPATDDLAADTDADDLVPNQGTGSDILDLGAITAEDCEAAGIGVE